MRTRFLRTLVLAFGAAVAVLWLPAAAAAQTGMAPYYGKNHVRYDRFEWHIYTTAHFEIYFYPEIQPQLERIASYAESAYQHISSELKHDLPFKIPLILYKTASEFQEQNISGELPEAVLAFSEPARQRIVLPIDEPSDQLYQTIVHELTHQFEFDIIPRGLISSGLPLWVDEGLADYMTGYWNPVDLMEVRDNAVSDTVPRMSKLESEPLAGRTPYSMGHAAFEFIESRWGKEGLRQFLFSLRKSVIGGGQSAYEEALKLKPEDFDDQFDRYLKDRFRPFRDKERPADYGRNLAPKADRTPFVVVLSLDPSPTGDILAAVAGNRKDQELDIILLSTKDGQVIRNLTKGFDKDRGFEYISTAGGLRGNMVPWIAWSPVGDRIAYFVRTEKEKTLIIQNVVSGKIEKRFPLKTVDAPESPAFSPDGRTVAFSGLRGAITDIYTIDTSTGEIANVTKDALADYAPTFTGDGKSLICVTRVSGSDKLFQIDLASGQRKQLTFGTHDDTAPKFYDDHTLVFTSTATDPNTPLTPAVARNGNILNVWTLDLTTGQLKQWTDTATGNVSPVVLRQIDGRKVAFVTYSKGEYGIHTKELIKPVATVASSDFGAPGPVVDFQPPLTHTLVPKNMRKKGAWEKMMLEGRPPVNVGVTSNGNLYGGTEIAFTDVLGDRMVDFYAASVSTFRTLSFTYVNLEHRLNYAFQGLSQDTFFYGQNVQNALYYDPSIAPFITRDLAQSEQSVKMVNVIGIYPFNRYTRAEISAGYLSIKESYIDPNVQAAALAYQQAIYGTALYRSGNMLPLSAALVQETTIFREFGPLAGGTMRLAYSMAPQVGSFLSEQTADADARHYTRIGTTGVLAVRLRGFKSWGDAPNFTYFGGNSEMRGYDYLQFLGHKAFFANAELRFPLIEAMKTPIGVLGGVRGVFFVDLGGAGVNGSKFTPWTFSSSDYTPVIAQTQDPITGAVANIFGPAITINGFRLVDARASYGIGLETFAFGFPVHFDWCWRTMFNSAWEDALFSLQGGSLAFRAHVFKFWIGYDF
jgi:hypothetical protein